MSEQQDFCAGVKILLERMKTNPEDFGYSKISPNTLRPVEPRFGKFADLMEGIVANRKGESPAWQEWHYLTKEEQSALIAGFKDMRRGQFDKLVMERVFDEDYYERQEREQYELERIKKQVYAAPYQQGLQNAQPHTFQTIATDNTSGGFFGGITAALGHK